MLKKFKNKEGFNEYVELSRSIIYFKFALYKCCKKLPALKNSILSLHYFRNHSKLIKTVCKSNEEQFSRKKNCINGFINHCCL